MASIHRGLPAMMLWKETNRVLSRVISQEFRKSTFDCRQRGLHHVHNIVLKDVGETRKGIFYISKNGQRVLTSIHLVRWNSTVSPGLNTNIDQSTPPQTPLQFSGDSTSHAVPQTSEAPNVGGDVNLTSSIPTVDSGSILETSTEATTVLSSKLNEFDITEKPPISNVLSEPSTIAPTTIEPTIIDITANEPLGSTDILYGGEASLASQGLGGWSPSGLIQTALDTLHVSCDVPWWISIVIGTCVVRLLMFPLVVMSQRNAARMNNYMPQMQVLQLKMTEARKAGNPLLAAKYAQELMMFMKEKNLNPIKNMMVPLAQAPVFISFFFALRGMANLPMESMKTGGAFWFVNLTVADPLYILPFLTSLSLYFTVELGVDAGMRTDNMQLMRYVLRAMPIIIFPFTMNFPAAVLCYWTTTNFLSLGQVAILRYAPIRSYFNIDPLVKHNPNDLPIPKKGFVEGFKDSYTNTKIVRQLEERIRSDELQFRKAGIGPIQKTYPFDPTKQTSSQFPVPVASAKPRDTK